MEKIKRKVSLNIAGSKISLVTDENPEYVEKLGALVSQRVNTLALSGNGISKMDAALVYALDLLDENFKLKVALAEAKKNNG
ncbi:MAG: cell division protein ZapA [Clostridia bacterium]|nr:cell division protein ZapA [Clostridia bacterium]